MILRIPISIEQLIVPPYGLWDDQWFLLTAGDFESKRFNTMTVSWGGLGVMWDKPVASVVVRPHRYTYEFIEQFPTFTLCAFSNKFHNTLDLLGSTSGRDGDKIKDSGLTPQKASKVGAPAFEQAELVLECKKLYWQDMDPAHFLDPTLDKHYPRKDYHRIYYGEIVAVAGVPAYLHHT